MKWLAFIFFALVALTDPTKVSKINSLKSEAKKAFLAGEFKTAIAKYRFLIDSMHVSEEEINMNLANAYFRTNDTTNAFTNYQPLTVSKDAKLKSWANQQMGVMANRQSKFEEALNYFKQALKAEPANEQARYNYEMVKKKLEEQKKQQQQNKDQNKENKDNKDKKDEKNKEQNKDNKNQQNKDQKDKQDQKDQQNKDKQDQQKKDQKDQQQKDQKDKEQQKKEQKDKEQQQKEQEEKNKNKDEKKPDPSLAEKLKDMQISEDKAKMILEAMKNQEIQYLQQNKRKATKPKEKGKPDW
ncbi:MAG: hypothetical protein JST48_02980 [Bacteroidetes bacterium]|nr:hypothetical protein [Bacteroidota bacterium]